MDSRKKETEGGGGQGEEKWAARNWKKKDERSLKKMAPQSRSRYLAYEEASKPAVEAQKESKRRLVETKKQHRRDFQDTPEDEVIEKMQHEKLIGQLKGAEARNRIRIMRLRYEANKSQEVNHLIACQPNARKAVRLQALLPVRPEDRSRGDSLDKIQRDRVECLLEDNMGLLTGRT